VTLAFWNTVTVLGLIATGCALQIRLFLNNAFGLYFFLLELFALNLIPIAFLFSALLRKSHLAVSFGFGMFFIGFFLQMGADIVYNSDSEEYQKIILALIPPSLLQIGLNNLGAATERASYAGLSWSDVDNAAVLR
jgi:hypothetical protein